MNIEQFVKTTLIEISEGVKVNFTDGKKEKRFYLAGAGVDFDLAVSVSTNDTEESKTSGGGNIKVVQAETSKSKTSAEKNESVSRVKFTVKTVNANDAYIPAAVL